MLKKMGLIALVLAVSMMSVSADAGSMAVTFPSQSGWTVSGVAGAPGYAQANWVNTNSDQSSWGRQYSLVDNTGAATGATMDWYASEIWSWYFDAADNDDERMMDAGIGAGTGKAEVHVVDIPYATYDVVVYFSSKMEFPYVTEYTVGSTSVYAQVPAMTLFGDNDTYVEVPMASTTNLQGSTPSGNYIVFKNVTGSTLDIQAVNAWYGNSIYTYQPGAPRATISGFQIVEVPEPATIALLGLGGLLSAFKKRNS